MYATSDMREAPRRVIRGRLVQPSRSEYGVDVECGDTFLTLYQPTSKTPCRSVGQWDDGKWQEATQHGRKSRCYRSEVSYEKALCAAVAAVLDSKPVSAELEGSDVVGPRWDTQVATSDGTVRSVRVDAVTGKADQPHTESDEEGDDRRELAGWLKRATVTAEQAARTATDKKKGTVTSIELDDSDDGKLMWFVDVVTTTDWNKTTFDIDATNRKILREHVDTD